MIIAKRKQLDKIAELYSIKRIRKFIFFRESDNNLRERILEHLTEMPFHITLYALFSQLIFENAVKNGDWEEKIEEIKNEINDLLEKELKKHQITFGRIQINYIKNHEIIFHYVNDNKALKLFCHKNFPMVIGYKIKEKS